MTSKNNILAHAQNITMGKDVNCLIRSLVNLSQGLCQKWFLGFMTSLSAITRLFGPTVISALRLEKHGP